MKKETETPITATGRIYSLASAVLQYIEKTDEIKAEPPKLSRP